ncbi:type 1 fimbrial major subunit FimA [Yersinia massiliensis]|jgi:major type 1 subunit fimbrin (pilin)|uniref:Fimbrial protein n=2 Tax=Yersinia TaxID=629 RepID=A0A2R4NRV8_9GAMM|nr:MULTISPECIES: type 1 fimbrial major subunit FimA [Yersinia]HEC1651561.1 type 1 fimbrial major subunit FimA [Yersinia enterocolitica]ATM85286.1 type-1 fimbrial protein subunit A [Yersinia frederiksenii]AVX38865.1 type-1 fimbrial protein subunit A [Yersinia massiliensis]MCB5316240.1 type 1 fimbrial major subunit FimA [Yersinia massiliensis]MDA5549780.1 type 1 fimbrial major subunit FimA [Yersinia massiliensis]
MKIKSLVAGIAAVLSLTGVANAATIVNGGSIHFKGEVVNAACAVDTGSIGQTVPMAQARTASLATAGDVSSSIGFNIQLNDCDPGVAGSVSIAFMGTAVNATYPTALALQASAAGNAENVGVQILDRIGTALAVDGATFSAETTLSEGIVIVPFQARYIATGTATAGIANADATFKVQYL